jgi:hypothetical protein
LAIFALKLTTERYNDVSCAPKAGIAGMGVGIATYALGHHLPLKGLEQWLMHQGRLANSLYYLGRMGLSGFTGLTAGTLTSLALVKRYYAQRDRARAVFGQLDASGSINSKNLAVANSFTPPQWTPSLNFTNPDFIAPVGKIPQMDLQIDHAPLK